jgi:hypothetical protein
MIAITLMMEAASTSETLVNFYRTTRRAIPEDCHLQTRRRENLKSHLMHIFLYLNKNFRKLLFKASIASGSLLLLPQSACNTDLTMRLAAKHYP